MKRYRLKKNNATMYVLPFLIGCFLFLVALSFIFPETSGMACAEIERQLTDHHKGIITMGKTMHQHYHDSLDACINKGYVVLNEPAT